MYDDDTEIGCLTEDQDNCTEDALEEYTFITEALTTFEWSSGLAKAAEDLRNSWLKTGYQSLQQYDGSDTWSRAKKYGIVGGSLSEYAFWLDAGVGNTMKIKATDCVLTMLIGDGDPDKVARNAIFDTSDTGNIYTQIGAAVGSSANNRYVMCDIIFAENYEVLSTVAECGVESSFGGGPCDPSTSDMELFYWINQIRLHPDDERIIAELENILDSFDEYGTISTYDYDGNDVTEMKAYSANGDGNVSAALQRLVDMQIDQANEIYLNAFKWSPGLYFAAQDQSNYLKTLTATSHVGTANSDVADRIKAYGDGVAYESFITGTNDELNMALTLLIDDADSEKKTQKMLLSDSLVYMSLATSASTTLKQVTTVLFSDEYTTSTTLATC